MAIVRPHANEDRPVLKIIDERSGITVGLVREVSVSYEVGSTHLKGCVDFLPTQHGAAILGEWFGLQGKSEVVR